MKYCSAIKGNEIESVEMRWMSLESVIQSQSEREKQIYINAYIWNLDKWYWLTYLQGRYRDADAKKGLVDTVREGERYELRQQHCAHSRAWKQPASGRCCTAQGAQPAARRRPGGMGRGSEPQGGGDWCIHMAGSRGCTAETNIIKQLHPNNK